MGEPFKFWNSRRRKAVSAVIGCGLILAFVVEFVRDEPNKNSMFSRGDYPAFYSAAKIVESGDGERLYDQNQHRIIQNRAWPAMSGEVMMSVYPPFTSVLFSPFAKFPPGIGKCIATILALGAFFLSFSLMGRLVPSGERSMWKGAIFCFCCAPVASGVIAAQNSALSLLLFLLAGVFLKRNDRFGEILAGLCLSLWLFKPQYALFGLGYLLLSRRWWAIAGALPIFLIFSALSENLLGSEWLVIWSKAAGEFGLLNYTMNGFQMVSVIGALSAVSQSISPESVLPTWVVAGALVATVPLGLFVISLALRGGQRSVPTTNNSFLSGYLMLGAATPFLSPQTLYYDLIMLVPALIALVPMKGDKDIWRAIGWNVTGSVAFVLTKLFHFPFMFLWAVPLLVLELILRDSSSAERNDNLIADN